MFFRRSCRVLAIAALLAALSCGGPARQKPLKKTPEPADGAAPAAGEKGNEKKKHPPVDVRVVPGKSAGKLKLGGAYNGVVKLLDEPTRSWPRKEEARELAKMKIYPAETVSFYLDYETCDVYDQLPGDCSVPVSQVHYKDVTVVMITLVMTDVADLDSAILVGETVRLGTPVADVEKEFGPGVRQLTAVGLPFLHYWEKGVTFMVADDRVCAVQIYEPLPGEKIKKFEAAIARIDRVREEVKREKEKGGGGSAEDQGD